MLVLKIDGRARQDHFVPRGDLSEDVLHPRFFEGTLFFADPIDYAIKLGLGKVFDLDLSFA